MSVTPELRKPKGYASNWQAQVSITHDHTLKSRVKGNFHARFGIGGGESDLSADHSESRNRNVAQRGYIPEQWSSKCTPREKGLSFCLKDATPICGEYLRTRGHFLEV